jgi:PAS domain S-box-containing protein
MTPLVPVTSGTVEDEISELIGILHRTEKRLEELTAGVDAAVDGAGGSFMRRRAQEQFRLDGAERQAAILNALPAQIALLDARGTIVSVNEPWRQFARANGLLSPAYGVGLNYLELCERPSAQTPFFGAQAVAEGIRGVLNGTRKMFSIEYPCHTSSEQRWFLMAVTPLTEGGRDGAIVSHVNVTERRVVAAKLAHLSESTAQRERLLSTMLASISDFTYIFDQRQRFLFANKPLLDLWGLTLAEVVGRNFLDLGYPPELAARLHSEIGEVFATGTSIPGEVPYLSSSGHAGTYEYIFSPVVAEGGAVEFVVGATRNITERKRAGAALKASEREQRHLAEKLEIERSRLVAAQRVAKVGSWETDLTTFEVLWSEETHRIHGTDPATFPVSHQGFLDLVHPDDRLAVDEAFARSFFEHSPCSVEHRIVLPGGRVKFVDERWQVLFDATDKAVRAIGTCQDITERKLAEAALRTSETEFRTLAEAMPQIVWIADGSGASTYCNQHWFDYTGMTLEESLGDGWNTSFHPDDRQQAWDAWQRAIETRSTYSIESRLRDKEGRHRWWLVRGKPLADAGGNVVKWFGTCTDIHDLKIAELEILRANGELRESERRFSDMLGNVEMISLMLDTGGVITYCNDYLLRVTGWSREEVIGRNWFEQFIPGDAAAVERTVAALIDSPAAAAHHENQILTRSGERRLIRWNNTTLRSLSGDVMGTASLGEDVTESRRAESRLRLQSAALNAAADAIVITDRDLSIVWSNNAFTKLTGYADHEALGKNPQELLNSGAHDADFFRRVRETVRSGSSWRGEMMIRRKDGQLYPEAQTLTPVKDDAGVVTNFIAIKNDLTSQRQMEAQLRRSQKLVAMGQLAAGVAHEFNNLLQALMSMATITRLKGSQSEIVKLGGEMETQIRRGSAITQQLLLFSRQHVMSRADFDVREHVDKVSTLLRRLMPENIRMVVEVSPERLSIEGDAGQMQQVMINLAINARDAMTKGGTLTLRTGCSRREVFLEVEDTGQGMDEATRARIFEPFFSTKETGKGTGLGLAVAYGIVEQHGGRIEVDSSPGQGSRFRVILPAVFRESEALPQDQEVEEPLPRGTGLVLLVEDEETVREGIMILLELIGYRVIGVGSAEEALSLAAQEVPDVLLTDLTLPGLAGSALAAILRARWPALKVILMSGYMDATQHESAIERGWFLQKPFDLTELARQLRAALDDEDHRSAAN